jgi:hypothetical protein
MKMMSQMVLVCSFQLGAKDSLDNFGNDDEMEGMTYSAQRQLTRHSTRDRPVLGVRSENQVFESGYSGYKWKKKWRDRKERSKQVHVPRLDY